MLVFAEMLGTTRGSLGAFTRSLTLWFSHIKAEGRKEFAETQRPDPLQGAMQGIQMATPIPENPFPFADPPKMESGDIRGWVHFNEGDYNPTVDIREPGEFDLWTPRAEPKDSIW